MEKEIRQINLIELEERIRELEDTYAELLADNSDARTLSLVWKEIQSIKAELDSGNN